MEHFPAGTRFSAAYGGKERKRVSLELFSGLKALAEPVLRPFCGLEAAKPYFMLMFRPVDGPKRARTGSKPRVGGEVPARHR